MQTENKRATTERRRLADQVEALDRLIARKETLAIVQRLVTQGTREDVKHPLAVSNAPVAPLAGQGFSLFPAAPVQVQRGCVPPPFESLLSRIFAYKGGDRAQQKRIRSALSDAPRIRAGSRESNFAGKRGKK